MRRRSVQSSGREQQHCRREAGPPFVTSIASAGCLPQPVPYSGTVRRPARAPRLQPGSLPSVAATYLQLASPSPSKTSQLPAPASALSSIPKPRSASWLTDAVPFIVRSCVGTSLLHVVRRTAASALEVQAYPVPSAAEGSLEYWRECAQQARLADAEGFVLVRPIPSPSSCCWNPGGCCEAHAASSSPSDTDSPGHPQQPAARHSLPLDAATLGDSDPGRPAEFGTTFYGMVVQSSVDPSSAAGTPAHNESCHSNDGCFLLKLCQAAGADSAVGCKHYSMTRVCRGQPLHSQLYESWLA